MAEPITAFILTKDRACQLHLLLESIQRNLPGLFKPYILWKATSRESEQAYTLLHLRTLEHNPGWTSWQEERTSLRQEFYLALEYARNRSGLLAIFTDDCIVYRKSDLSRDDIDDAMDERVLCFSLRLGVNTIVQDYSTGRLQTYPVEQEWAHSRKAWRWNWKREHFSQNFGYPVAMDGIIYRAEDLLEMTDKVNFDNFRTWEGVLSGEARRGDIKREWMAAPTLSCVVNVPSNTVQDPPIPSGRFFPCSTTELNERYLAGEVIDLNALDCSNIIGAHCELAYKFVRCLV